ncbi:MAG TPA: dihydropteroate synthase [Rikenellaceae bacterium]|nr:dihydropteroate synthase [Rikenellaceae bacterium]
MGNNVSRNIQVMGIVNLTDDSFFAGSRNLRADGTFDEELFRGRIVNMLESGADILDLGACSTRPGSDSISGEEEWRRLEPALRILGAEHEGVRVSIDTFRPEVVSRAFDIIGPFIVNDVSGGCEEMWSLLGQLGLPYIAMHTRGTPKNMLSLTDYDNVTEAVREFFVGIATEADKHGVNDWILDPGFGFAKTVEQNWQLLREMSVLLEFSKEILVGLSRKSFLFRPLGITPTEALPATQVADFIALQNGADILRVHDVAEAVRTVKLYRLLYGIA